MACLPSCAAVHNFSQAKPYPVTFSLLIPYPAIVPPPIQNSLTAIPLGLAKDCLFLAVSNLARKMDCLAPRLGVATPPHPAFPLVWWSHCRRCVAEEQLDGRLSRDVTVLDDQSDCHHGTTARAASCRYEQ